MKSSTSATDASHRRYDSVAEMLQDSTGQAPCDYYLKSRERRVKVVVAAPRTARVLIARAE